MDYNFLIGCLYTSGTVKQILDLKISNLYCLTITFYNKNDEQNNILNIILVIQLILKDLKPLWVAGPTG